MTERLPLISIVIPVKNGGPWLQKTLDAIFAQTLIADTEVIIIDSGSTDESLRIIQKFPVRLISIPPQEFNHGETRNQGAREARGKYVVMTVQDAEPVNDTWLQQLLEGFDVGSVAGVCGQQVVTHDVDKNPIDWFRPISKPGIRKYPLENKLFNTLAPSERMMICSWDNVNAMYKKEALIQVPFQPVAFAEDALWAKEALEQGYEIVYNTRAQVKHYHFETPDYTFRRSFTVHYHFFKVFGIKPETRANGIIRLLADLKILVLENKIEWRDKIKWLLYNYQQRKAVNLSASIFLKTLAQGEEKLFNKHFEICHTVPQAPGPWEKKNSIVC